MAGVPVVVNTVHGLYATADDSFAKRATVYSLEAVAARCSDAELFQNPEDLALAQRLRITRHARLLGNGVDLARFDPDRFPRAARRAMRTQLGITDDDTIVVGTVGRLVVEKGYRELFEALRALPTDRFTLVVAGAADPDKPDALDDAAMQDARERGVRLLGQRDDVDALYCAMDLFVLASHREGFPRAAMEAAAMGLPVVATNVRGCRQVVDDGITGLLVPVRDPAALAGAIRTLGDDGARRRTMGIAALARAQDQFDERRVVGIVMDTYREAAHRKGLRLAGLDR
jgi:glycosyltransferase involved in cell wall biosynthesis